MTERRSTDATEPPATSWATELAQRHITAAEARTADAAARTQTENDLRAALAAGLATWIDELEAACRGIVGVVAEHVSRLELAVMRTADRPADQYVVAVRSHAAGLGVEFRGQPNAAVLVVRARTSDRGYTSPEPFALIDGALSIPTRGDGTPAGVARAVLEPWLDALLGAPGVLTSLREPATERAIEEGATS